MEVRTWAKPIPRCVCHSDFLVFHRRVEGLGQIAWFFTAIYASPRERERRELLQDLWDISKGMT